MRALLTFIFAIIISPVIYQSFYTSIRTNKYVVNSKYYCNSFINIFITSKLFFCFIHGNNRLLGLLLFLYIKYNFLSNNLIITYKSQNIHNLTLCMMCFIPNWSQSIFSNSLYFNILGMSFSSVCHRQWLGPAS